MPTRRLSIVLALAAAWGCGGSATGPTLPSTAPIVSLTVSSTSTQVLLGASETFTVIASRSDGTSIAISGATWSGDAPAVATVEAATGKVTGVKTGTLNVSVTSQGLSASKAITVRPNYAGLWQGTYTVNSCVQIGDWIAADYCTSTFVVGTALPHQLLFVQSLATLTGQTALGSLVGTVTSAGINADGSALVFASFASGTTNDAEAWSLNVAQPGTMTGTLVQLFTDSTAAGQMLVGCTLNSTTLVQAAAAARFGARGSGPPDPRSIIDAIRR
jgi:hypothetical protein